MSTQNRFAFFEGAIVPIEQAKVSIMTNGLNYGTGCFEGIRAYWNSEAQQLLIFHLRAHMERLKRSCHILMMDLPYSADELCQITLDLLRHEEFRTDTYIRPLVYKSEARIAVQMNNMADAFALFAIPYGQYIAGTSARVCVSSWRRIEDNIMPARAKPTGAYLNTALAKTEALLNGYDEAIVLSSDGQVSEASSANLFLVRNGTLITPPMSSDILEGITRQLVIDLAHTELQAPVVERAIDRTELYVADEVFFCGTGVEIKPIIEIDRRSVGDGQIGPISQRLVKLYGDVVHGRVERYADLCTPVY